MSKKWWLAVPVVLGAGYLAGPSPETPVYNQEFPNIPAAPSLDSFIHAHESMHHLKPNNEARVVWADSASKQKTPYSIVYLHGFSSCQEEGEPLHRNLAKLFGCNLYLSRLAEHGIDTTEPMMNLTAEGNWTSAKEALAIGKQLGDKVILVGTSTGGTNALQLAAAYPSLVDAIVMLSPNIAINNDKAYLLNNHWGLNVAQWVTGSDHNISTDTSALYKQYWYTRYSFKAAAALQEILETSMTPETFAKVKQPALLLYYYKDQVHQDSVVRVDAMLKMFDQLGTPASLKRKCDIPTAGNHVMGSFIKSHDVPAVQEQIVRFMQEVLKMQPIVPKP